MLTILIGTSTKKTSPCIVKNCSWTKRWKMIKEQWPMPEWQNAVTKACYVMNLLSGVCFQQRKWLSFKLTVLHQEISFFSLFALDYVSLLRHSRGKETQNRHRVIFRKTWNIFLHWKSSMDFNHPHSNCLRTSSSQQCLFQCANVHQPVDLRFS